MQKSTEYSSSSNQLVSKFNEEGIAVAIDNEGYYHINNSGKELYKSRFDSCRNFKDQKSVVSLGDSYFHIMPSGERFYKANFSFVSDFHSGFAVVRNKESKLFSHIDTNGNYLYNYWYEETDVFFGDYARAKDNEGWFHINKNGEAIYPQRFLKVDVLLNDHAKVTDRHNQTHVIKDTGEIVQTLEKRDGDYFQQVSGEIVSYWKTQVIKSAVDFNIFKYLPSNINILSANIEIEPSILKRLLRALMEIGFVVEKNGMYFNTETSKYLDPEHELSLVSAVYHWATENYIAWMGLTKSLKEGKASYKEFYNSPIFDWLDENKELLQQYHKAIKTYAEYDYPNLVSKLDLSSSRIVIDAAGGQGIILKQLLTKFPHLEGYLLERQSVTEIVEVPKNLENRMNVCAFDLFNTWPVTGDLIILSRILHDWNDYQCKQILENSYSSLKAGGKIIIIEMLLSEDNPNGGLLDLNMLVITGGKERTLEDITKLMTEVGFSYSKIVHYNNLNAIEFIKN